MRNLKIIFKSHGWVEVWVWKDKGTSSEDFDILTEFDLIEEKNSQGYYCSLCQETEYYPDRETMWEKHVYELLLEWAIDNIKPENYLCVFESENKGGLCAKILTMEELKKRKDEKLLVFCKPVIKEERG